tara:strand:+ start:2230 stop:3543 length:1314 start_codon:yes stop_codon:yes gene_type:complete
MTTKVQAEFLAAGIISDQTQVSAASTDHVLIFDASDNSLKKALVSTIASGATALDDIGTGDAASTLATSSGDIIIDSPDGIILDADGDGTLSLKDGGTRYALIEKSSDSLLIRADLSDGDILFQGKDNTSLITALTLDMSEAGKAIFNGDISIADNKKLLIGAGDDLQIYHDGSNSIITDAGTGGLFLRGTDTVDIQSALGHNYLKSTISAGTQIYYDNSEKFATVSGGIKVTGDIENASGNMRIDVAGKLFLESDDGRIDCEDGGHTYYRIENNSGSGARLKAMATSSSLYLHTHDGSGTDRIRYVVGSGGNHDWRDVSGNTRAELSASGDLVTAGNITAYGSPSDIVLKENVSVIDNAMEKVTQLKGITYDLKSDGNRLTGLVAQDLEKVLPEAVYTAQNLEGEEHLAIRYGNTVGLLVEAIKELEARIKDLEGK